MKDLQNMKKAVKVTVQKVQNIFVRRRSSNTSNFTTQTSEENGNKHVEDGLEVCEDLRVVSQGYSTESSPEPLEVISSPEEENCNYFKFSQRENRRSHGTSQNVLDHSDLTNINKSGASGLINEISKSNLELAVVPVNCRQDTVQGNACYSVVLTSCGDLEKQCSDLPLILQEKVFGIKENLLWQYPPFYDFCVIASDDDMDEAVKFKNYVASSFGLAGCTLDDGFMHLGAELFDCYETMMDHCSKVFFFVTENFSSNAFCKRLQSGAVFLSLMSKAKKDREKCVPVYPPEFPRGCKVPLALLGVAGLNLSQLDITRRSIVNTYSPQLRQRRFVLDQENYRKRCLEFKSYATKCIEEYKKSIENEMAVVSENYCSIEHITPSIDEPSTSVQTIHSLEETPSLPSIGSQNLANTVPDIHISEHDDYSKNNVEDVNSKESKNNQEWKTEIDKENVSECKKSNEVPSESQKNKFDKIPENSKLENDTSSKSEDGNKENKDEIWKNLPIPEEIREMVNNSSSSVSINDCATVQVGHVINITINQASATAFSHCEQDIKSKSGSFRNKEETELSDSD